MDKALLDLMNDMFSVRIDGPIGGQKFSLYNFVYCYKHIFRSTLLYESASLSMRQMMWAHWKQDNRKADVRDWGVGFGIGAGT